MTQAMQKREPDQKAAAQQKPKTIEESIALNKSKIEAALDGYMDVDKYIRICATVYRNGGDRMRKADWTSVVLSILEAAQLELTPGGVLGECYIIPRYNGRAGRMEANFQLGYRGAMKLARRGGAVRDIQAECVYEKDDFRITLGTDRGIHHVPYFGDDRGKIIGAYATAILADGSMSFRAITKSDIDKAKSASGDPRDPNKISDAWRDHEPSMARKTAIHRLVKYLPIPDAQAKEAIIRDEYRESGQDESKISPHSPELVREIAKSHPVYQSRKEREDSRSDLWDRSKPLFKMANVHHGRYEGGVGNFNRFIMWMANSDETWPDAKDPDGQIYFLRLAKAGMKRWEDAPEEEQRDMSAEFADHIQAAAEREMDARAEAKFEASQGGENE